MNSNTETDFSVFAGVKVGEHSGVYNVSAELDGVRLKNGEKIVVETTRGVDMATVTHPVTSGSFKPALSPVKAVLRRADERDLQTAERLGRREKELYAVFVKKIWEHRLQMKPINVECMLDGNKVLFYFTSETRVDFRMLVKELASACRCRVELRQVGIRDEARLLGGLGICGREFCCKSFLRDFLSVSIRMAKDQSLSLNPTKTAGTCGRLMCCLKYEQSCYDELIKAMPRPGTVVETPEGAGMVEEVNVIAGTVKVRLKERDASVFVKKDELSFAAQKAKPPAQNTAPVTAAAVTAAPAEPEIADTPEKPEVHRHKERYKRRKH